MSTVKKDKHYLILAEQDGRTRDAKSLEEKERIELTFNIRYTAHQETQGEKEAEIKSQSQAG